MLVTNYKVFIADMGDGVITFKHEGKYKKVLIPKSNTIAKEIFDKYYNQRNAFRYKYYAIAKFIVRDIRKAGYVFKIVSGKSKIISPIKDSFEKGLPTNNLTDEKLYHLFHEFDKRYKQMVINSPENEFINFKC